MCAECIVSQVQCMDDGLTAVFTIGHFKSIKLPMFKRIRSLIQRERSVACTNSAKTVPVIQRQQKMKYLIMEGFWTRPKSRRELWVMSQEWS